MTPNIVFFPGVLCDDSLWDDLKEPLSKIAQLHFVPPPTEMTIHDMTETALPRMPKKFWAVGFSLGGWMALETIKLRPDAIEGLILISTTNGYMSQKIRLAMQKAIQVMQQNGLEEYLQLCAAVYFMPSHIEDNVIQKRFYNMANALGAETVIRQYQAIVNSLKPYDHLAKITCPTLVVRGEHEQRATLEEHQKLCDQIPRAQLEIIQDSAHFIPLEQGKRLSNVILKFMS